MQVTETLSDGLKRGFTVVLPVADLESRRVERLTNLGRNLRLPGFRPGRVPMPIVKQRYGTAVSAEILEESVTEASRQVLAERGLRPAQQPKIDLVTENPTALIADLEFKMELELLPDITVPDLGAISLTRLKVEVTPEMVDEALRNIAKTNRERQPIDAETLESRGYGVQKGEDARIDFLGKIDGVPFDGGSGTDVDVEVGGTGFIPGFLDGIEGMKTDETRTIDVTFPTDYSAADLAGKAATFDITCKQVSLPVIPSIDDNLATKLGYENLDELRQEIIRRRQREFDGISRQRVKTQLLDQLADRVSFPVPPTLVEQEFGGVWQQIENARKAGTEDADDKGKDEETLRAEYRAISERRVRLALLLAEIARVNNIAVTEQELNRGVYQRAMAFPGQEAQMLELFKKYPSLAGNVQATLLEDKVVDYVLELATVTDQPVTAEELEKDPEETETPPPAEHPGC